jgi:hypothetical protein
MLHTVRQPGRHFFAADFLALFFCSKANASATRWFAAML